MQGCKVTIGEPFPTVPLSHILRGILSINKPLVVATLKIQNRPIPIQNLFQMLRLVMPLTYQEDTKGFITHVMRLYEENKTGFQSWSENVLREQGKVTGLDFCCG